MSLSQRWQEIRTGFERPFWVANITELFERLSYYAAFASLARYLNEALGFPISKQAASPGSSAASFGSWLPSAELSPIAWAFAALCPSPTSY